MELPDAAPQAGTPESVCASSVSPEWGVDVHWLGNGSGLVRRGERKVLGMIVAKKHGKQPLALDPMPHGARIRNGSGAIPVPVPHDELGDRTQRHS